MEIKYQIISFVGFVLVVVGGFMKATYSGSSDFLTGFGYGLALAGSICLLYEAYENKSAKKTAEKQEA